jgi:hypothetical protein
MQIIKPFLKNMLSEMDSKNDLFRRNKLKEYLQVVVLDFIYSHPRYSRLVFYGGSCLAQCYGLSRLSEDLDFVDAKKEIKLKELALDLGKFFKETDLKPVVVIQKFRIYLKFPLLKELGLAEKGESDLLFLKVEVFSRFDFCRKYKIETIPLFKYNRSILIKTFDLPTLMATKIRAVLYRKWEKTDKKGKTLIKVKGRDYFDLMWYLEKGVKPNLRCVENMENESQLKKKLLDLVSQIDSRSIKLDLEAFIDDEKFVRNLSRGIKDILKKSIQEKM